MCLFKRRTTDFSIKYVFNGKEFIMRINSTTEAKALKEFHEKYPQIEKYEIDKGEK